MVDSSGPVLRTLRQERGSFGAALRTLRLEQGLSAAALAAKVSFSRQTLGNVETGTFLPSEALAAALDSALRSSPLLVTLLQIEKGGDDVNRRALLGTVGAAGAGALFSTMDGTAAMAAVLDSGLRNAVSKDTDYDQLVDDFARRRVLAPSNELANELAAQLAVARERVAGGDKDASRGAAQLALTYGLLLADRNKVATAHGLYGTAAALADHSGDTPVRALVRARAATRGIYEGWTLKRTTNAADEALAISNTGPAALEAYGAQVHIHALTGNLSAGRTSLDAMRTVAETLASDTRPSPVQRVANFAAYLHCRIGSLDVAQRAYEEAEAMLRPVPLWHADATVYMGRALVRAGAVEDGAKLALGAVRSLPFGNRILGMGVRDVLAAVPAGYRGDTVVQLRMHACAGPAPWDTLN